MRDVPFDRSDPCASIWFRGYPSIIHRAYHYPQHTHPDLVLRIKNIFYGICCTFIQYISYTP